jgi:hypothetical protein
MGRLKQDHSGYRTSGLYLKYQMPSVDEHPLKFKKKKDTKKWCRGKVGVGHDWHRFQHKRYDWERDEYYGTWIEIRCLECGKTTYKRIAKTGHLPLHAFIYGESEQTQIQCRVNGKIIPFEEVYHDKWYCRACRQWHQD